MSTLSQDVRYAFRTLERTPGFSFIVILTLGLGIGANTAIFSLMDQVLLRLLPVKNPHELVQLDGPGPFSGRTENDRTFSHPMYVDFRDRNDVFSGLVAQFGASATLTQRGQAERVDAVLVSGNTFDVMGVGPVVGRALSADDDRTPGAHPVTVLSYNYWQRRFAGSPAVLNQVVTINSTPMTIVGVAPKGFAGIAATQSPDLFIPLMMKAQITPTWNDLDNRRSRWLNVIGRLKPGLDPATAKARLDVVYAQINESELTEVPAFAAASQGFKDRFRAKKITLHPAGQGLSDLRQRVTTPLLVLMAMVGLVLLIACANVANLLLSRATARQKEIAVRLALGAARGRLIRQTLTESLVLAGAGGIVGLVFSIWVGDLLLSVMPSESFTRSLSTEPDLRVGLFTAGLALATAVLFGLIPALQSSKPQLNRTLRQEAGNLSGGTHHARFRKGLVVAQVALSMLLVAGAGLFARSLYNMKTLDTGVNADNLVTFRVAPALNGYDQLRIKRFYDDLLREVRQIPGVVSASVAQVAALTGSANQRTVQVQGYQPKPDENMNPWTNEIAPDYFRTMGLPLRMGREFSERDAAGAPLVAIVNESFAKYYFPNQSPIGQRFGFRVMNNPAAVEIVGVVSDALYADMRQGTTAQQNETPRFVYTPFHQSSELNEMTVYVRTTGGTADEINEQLQQVVRRADPSMPIFEMQSMEQTVDEALFNERMLALLSASFGSLATVLAAIGLYGVMSYTVSRRTREIGIRIALGAERKTVVWLVLREVAMLTVVGIGLGVPGALALSRLVRSQLFGIEPSDPLTLAIAAVTLAAVGLLAGYIPARRAASVQPVLALRYE
ncbi:MAG TPA: ABC transporter permease [Vicinamibacterales bacterium]|nr:ABC transporter permease [Vicinamibacterales bacterium]